MSDIIFDTNFWLGGVSGSIPQGGVSSKNGFPTSAGIAIGIIYEIGVNMAQARAWANSLLDSGGVGDSGNWSLYLVWDNNPNTSIDRRVWYVGITADFRGRELAHRRNFEKFGSLLEGGTFAMTRIDSGLSHTSARVREQVLMLAFGTLGGANIISSIAFGNWSLFEDEVHRFNAIISNIP